MFISLLSKVIYRSLTILGFFVVIFKLILKLMYQCKRSRLVETVLKRAKCRMLALPDF